LSASGWDNASASQIFTRVSDPHIPDSG
jgi:hypothetical protein